VNESTRIILDALDPAALATGRVQPPYPLRQRGATADGAIKWYVNGLLGARRSSFSRECGFSIEQMYSHTVTASEVGEQMDKVVERHDHPSQGINELVIVAGGPDRFGDGLVDEGMMAEVFLDRWQGEITPPKSIRRVVLDNWVSGTLDILFEA
jgi:hypothetical protein